MSDNVLQLRRFQITGVDYRNVIVRRSPHRISDYSGGRLIQKELRGCEVD